ncbi:hypothetical protein [Imhoffiella purpurea]|uniref:Nucleotidyltransferase n=1 Tax=Imhoffiella purpurea TaxID=1249627 RepID=W9W3F0_9GAMM|nr:hypothetical protein [Imhoffiella purpurea]EXJ17095.1 hypothetical protein D779_0847 [Imhoffiella purpurea]
MSGRDRSSALKERMAYETARIMVEQGLSDFDRARRKAAQRTGIMDRRNWPSNEAVHEAVLTQRRLFLTPDQSRASREMQVQALEAMHVFNDFAPRLVGSALMGSGDPQTGVELFLFADRPEDVLFALMERQIPWQESERSLRYPDGSRCVHPVFRFMAGDIPFQLVVLPWRAQRHPPLDPVTDRPQRGAARNEIERMLEESDSAYRFEIGR